MDLNIGLSLRGRELDFALGDSITVNGCCLTVVDLETRLRFGGKMGGHFVTGHLYGLGVIEVIEARRADRYLIYKGNIAIADILLTGAETLGKEFWTE